MTAFAFLRLLLLTAGKLVLFFATINIASAGLRAVLPLATPEAHALGSLAMALGVLGLYVYIPRLGRLAPLAPILSPVVGGSLALAGAVTAQGVLGALELSAPRYTVTSFLLLVLVLASIGDFVRRREALWKRLPAVGP